MYAALTYAPTYTYSCVHRHLLTPSLLVKKKKSLKIFSYHPSLAHAHKEKKKVPGVCNEYGVAVCERSIFGGIDG